MFNSAVRTVPIWNLRGQKCSPIRALYTSIVRTTPMKNFLHILHDSQVRRCIGHSMYNDRIAPKAKTGSIFQKVVTSSWDPIYMPLSFWSFSRVKKKSYFSLRKYFKRKIHKNSPLNTQRHSFVHQRSSCIIHAWFCIITTWLIRFLLTSSNFSDFLNKPSLYSLVCF